MLDIISSFTGQSYDTFERSCILKAENDVEDLKSQIGSMKQVLQSLNEQYEANRAELEAQIEVEKSRTASLKEDINAIEKKSQILQAYIGVLGTEEFSINQLKLDCDEHCKQYWVQLKMLNDESEKIKERLSKLREMQNKCNNLKDQANLLMAPKG